MRWSHPALRHLILVSTLSLLACSRDRATAERAGGAAATTTDMPSGGVAGLVEGYNGTPPEVGEGGVESRRMAPPRQGPGDVLLATEHHMTVTVASADMAARGDSARRLCQRLASCTLVRAEITSGEMAIAALTFRVSADSAPRLLTRLAALGEEESRLTRSENVAPQRADTERRLALLRALEARLEAIRDREARDVDAVLKVAERLAQIQQEVEALTKARADIDERVATELVHLSLQPVGGLRGHPVRDALARVANNIAQGTAGLIDMLSTLLVPVAALLLMLWGVLRWRRRRRVSAATTPR